jgi:phenylpyruvate tautomerase PptA (4-oxalocrotonate tautomerase family)
MPMVTIDAPEGAPPAAKQKMLKEITEALDEAYRIPDVRCWLREYPGHNVSQDGRVGAEPVRPVCSLDAPELASLDAKRKMVQKIDAAIAGAYQGIANTGEIVVLIRQYPRDNQGINQVFSARSTRSSGA